MQPENLVRALRDIAGNDAVLIGEEALPYYEDWRGRYSGSALAVVFPSSTGQVAGIVSLCAAMQISIVPQGGIPVCAEVAYRCQKGISWC